MTLLKKQLERQDYVDNKIHTFLNRITDGIIPEPQWDIEVIGNIRDAIIAELKAKNLLTEEAEQEFYPFIVTE